MLVFNSIDIIFSFIIDPSYNTYLYACVIPLRRIFSGCTKIAAHIRRIYNLRQKPIYIFSYSDYKKYNSLIKNKAGIYGIYNKASDKIYVGSAKDLNFRINQHFTNRYRSNIPLQNAFAKYGKETFIVVIFEIFDKSFTSLKEILREVEDYYFISLPKKYLYNIVLTSYTTIGYKHTEESKDKIRQKRLGYVTSEETKRKISAKLSGENNPFYGKTHTAEVRAKLSARFKGENHPLFGKPKSPEFLYYQTRDRRGSLNPMAKAVIVKDIIDNQEYTFPTLTAVAEFTNSQPKSVSKAFNEGRVLKSRWIITLK